jgi:hypothetical protein
MNHCTKGNVPALPRTMLFVGAGRKGPTMSCDVFLRPLLANMREEDCSTVYFRPGLAARETLSCTHPDSITLSYPRTRLPILCDISYRLLERRLDGYLARVTRYIERKRPEAMLFVLNSHELILLAARLAPSTPIPLIAMVWDVPERFFLRPFRHLSQRHTRIVMRAFDEVMRAAKYVIGVSRGMEEYLREHGATQTLHVPPASAPPIDESELEEIQRTRSSSTISIVFAGTMHSVREWNAFLRAVDAWNGRGHAPGITVDCLGYARPRNAERRRYVRDFGQLPPRDAFRVVARSHIAYLPFPMEPALSLDVRTSFPSKLATYVAAGIPVLYHGPAESTVGQFLEDYYVGKTCTTLAQDEIENTIRGLIMDPLFRAQYGQSRVSALRDEIGESVMLRKLSHAYAGISLGGRGVQTRPLPGP